MRNISVDGDAMTRRYVISVNLVIVAESEDEASTMVERALAGVAEHDIIDCFPEEVDERTD